MRNSNKNTIYVEDNNTEICKVSASSPLWLLREIFYFYFENLKFRLPWQPIKIDDWDKVHMVCRGLLREHFCKTFFQNICNVLAVNLSFHFSHCKSMETLSCHSSQSAWAKAIKKQQQKNKNNKKKKQKKNNLFVEAIVRNNYAKFQLYPQAASEELIF